MKEFLGFGLTRPFQRDLRSDFAAAGGEQLIRSAVGQIHLRYSVISTNTPGNNVILSGVEQTVFV
jgi:hypothetical protein